MRNHILFIYGGGNGGFEADEKLAASLKTIFGSNYEIYYPQMQIDEALPDFGWSKQIGNEISDIKSERILGGHSLVASMLIKYLT